MVRKWLIRVLVVVAALFAMLWVTWPWASQVTWLVPVEKELHSYLKKAAPVEVSLLQTYAVLQEDPSDRDRIEKILEDSQRLLDINERYWVEGKGQPWYRAFMYEIRGMDQPEDYLPSWPGPETAEGKAMLVDMRSDTATLAYQSWFMKESSNALANQMLAQLGDGSQVTQETLDSLSSAVAEAKRTKDDTDFVYKRWKGNYRPPLSIFR